jgi:hypothetical protein
VLLLDARKDRVSWSWREGDSTDPSQFGDPVAGGTGYDLCVYADDALLVGASVSGAALCDGVPCWRALKRGFLYRNARAPLGMSRLRMGTGASGTRIRATSLHPGLALEGAIAGADAFTVQLVRSDSPTACWTARLESLKLASSERLRASLP